MAKSILFSSKCLGFKLARIRLACGHRPSLSRCHQTEVDGCSLGPVSAGIEKRNEKSDHLPHTDWACTSTLRHSHGRKSICSFKASGSRFMIHSPVCQPSLADLPRPSRKVRGREKLHYEQGHDQSLPWHFPVFGTEGLKLPRYCSTGAPFSIVWQCL